MPFRQERAADPRAVLHVRNINGFEAGLRPGTQMEAPRAEFRVQEGCQRGPFRERNAAEAKAKRPVAKALLKELALPRREGDIS